MGIRADAIKGLIKHENRIISLCADDSVIVSQLVDTETLHSPVLNDFVKWCDESRLHLKTKDVVTDFRKSAHAQQVISIEGQTIDKLIKPW